MQFLYDRMRKTGGAAPSQRRPRSRGAPALLALSMLWGAGALSPAQAQIALPDFSDSSSSVFSSSDGFASPPLPGDALHVSSVTVPPP